MQLRIRHCIFNQFKEIGEHRNNQKFIIKHWLEIISCSILVLRYVLAIGSYLWEDESFQYWRRDPLMVYLYECFGEAFVIYLIIVIMPLIFAIDIVFIYYLYSTEMFIFQYLYQLIVVNIEQIKQCLIDERKQQELFLEEYRSNLRKLKTNAGIFWHIPLISFVLKRFCFYKTHLNFQFSKKIIDEKRLSNMKLSLIGGISIKCRLKLAKTITFNDFVNYIIHLLTGNR